MYTIHSQKYALKHLHALHYSNKSKPHVFYILDVMIYFYLYTRCRKFDKLVQSIFPLKMDVHTFVCTNSNLISNKVLVL